MGVASLQVEGRVEPDPDGRRRGVGDGPAAVQGVRVGGAGGVARALHTANLARCAY